MGPKPLNQELAKKRTEELSKQQSESFVKFMKSFDDKVGSICEPQCKTFSDCTAHVFQEFSNVLMGTAVQACEEHGIDPYEFTDGFLDWMKEHNDVARKATQALRAFDEHETVGMC